MSNHENVSKKSLKDRAKEFSVRLPFMDGRDKGELNKLHGMVSTICDYGFLRDEKKNQDYVVFITKERAKEFFFGGQVLTDQLMQLDAEGYRDEIVTEGLPVLFGEKKSKNGMNYTTVEFYPEDHE